MTDVKTLGRDRMTADMGPIQHDPTLCQPEQCPGDLGCWCMACEHEIHGDAAKRWWVTETGKMAHPRRAMGSGMTDLREALIGVSIAGHRRVEKYAEQEADAAARKDWSMADRWRYLASGNAETIAALDAALATLDAIRDPKSPQWEDCKVCGGDHWTKDHHPVPVPGLREALADQLLDAVEGVLRFEKVNSVISGPYDRLRLAYNAVIREANGRSPETGREENR